jgi:hypothetical protein
MSEQQIPADDAEEEVERKVACILRLADQIATCR